MTRNEANISGRNVQSNQQGAGGRAKFVQNLENTAKSARKEIDSSQQDDQVKELLRQLIKQVEQIAPSLPAISAVQMERDLRDLSNEASKPDPQREWYEVSLKGLKEAAEAVGQIAAPVATTAKALMKILL